MDLATLANLVSALAVVVGVMFAMVQLRYLRKARQREVAMALVQTFQTPEFARAIYLLDTVPDDLDKRRLAEFLGPNMPCIYLLMTTWESIGILVFNNELSLDLVDDFFSGPIVVSWQKLHHFVEEDRVELPRATYYEWFQWLAERMHEREAHTAPVPAYITHKNWKPRTRRAP